MCMPLAGIPFVVSRMWVVIGLLDDMMDGGEFLSRMIGHEWLVDVIV